ncbi:MAG TPA: 1,6-anhydro-N-acetylmuramyl-L-alanine amidase AmpD [Steroidobacteraceae bacterium]|jgi:AmpD protein|nr:1,6-anhydro-N-acetylmuramyl-L-alanine amidase AmpD [Steroidobacteraceae bacterium]
MDTAPVSPLQVEPSTGLLTRTRQVLSNHFDERPAGSVPELIVVHGISLPPGDYGGPWIEYLFTGTLPRHVHAFFATIPPGRVSSHVLVRRDGMPVQFVPFGARAWHAGISEYQGRPGCNDYSIGIELEGTDETAYEQAQYRTLSAVIAALLACYATLDATRIVGHSDIAPGRKSDPGAKFDWPHLRALVGSSAAAPIVAP